LQREALITPIWEGPSNIQALDMLEVISKKNAHLTLLDDMKRLEESMIDGKDVAEIAMRRMKEALGQLSSSDDTEAQFYAKDTLNALGHGIAAMMLLEIGNKLKVERFLSVGRLYALHFLEGKPYPLEALRDAKKFFTID
jgi:acyl-CoA dehydrogenase